MPNCLSAAKRLRQAESHRLRNKARKTELKTIREIAFGQTSGSSRQGLSRYTMAVIGFPMCGLGAGA